MVSMRVLGLSSIAGCIFGALGCSRTATPNIVSNACGGLAGSPKFEGLTWLAGSPTQANILCGVRQQSVRILMSLDPESRDPLLFRDTQSANHLLVERFSGRQARPSRLTWFAESGDRLGQRGDWPQNVYSISLSAPDAAIITGFDSGVVQQVGWKTESFAQPNSAALNLSDDGSVRPIHVLNRGAWVAVIDNGYDLVRFAAKDARIYSFKLSNGLEQKTSSVIRDAQTGRACLNAFQSFSLSRSRVLLSCNPQYFGPASGQSVSVFDVSLDDAGGTSTRELVHFDGANIQKIDIFGTDPSAEFVFLGYKQTTTSDYAGQIASSGWLNFKTGQWIPETRFAGPVQILAGDKGLVVACLTKTDKCSQGEFLHVSGGQPFSADATLEKLPLSPELPFLSFAQDVRHK